MRCESYVDSHPPHSFIHLLKHCPFRAIIVAASSAAPSCRSSLDTLVQTRTSRRETLVSEVSPSI